MSNIFQELRDLLRKDSTIVAHGRWPFCSINGKDHKSAAVPYKVLVSYLTSYNEVFNDCSLLEIIRSLYGVIYNQW